MLSNQVGGNVKKQREYEGNQNKDNIKYFIGENEKERIHKKVEKTGKTNVQQLLENSEVLYPPKNLILKKLKKTAKTKEKLIFKLYH